MKFSNIVVTSPSPIRRRKSYTYIIVDSVFSCGLNCVKQKPARRRFLLRRNDTLCGISLLRNDNCSHGEEGLLAARGISARFASQWNSYLEYKASCIAPMGVEILFLFCCLRVPQATKKKKIVADSGTESFMECRTAAFKN